MRVVMDTNVLVAGMLSGASPPSEVLHQILQGTLTLLVDARIVAEYDEVTARERCAFDPLERRALLDTLVAVAQHVEALPLNASLPDTDDIMFVEVAAAGNAAVLITGNVRHYPDVTGQYGFVVQTPRRFMESMRGVRDLSGG
jgi:putative PIN family toxin of toxin-antitoxin system